MSSEKAGKRMVFCAMMMFFSWITVSFNSIKFQLMDEISFLSVSPVASA
jgi:hypothetical protein